ncbi:hypothetical protein VTN77DRAFT_7933 [Rasamsonia byssochlamydoides]|uniref:uncharacterized protein n=1 Tax=Rasamsonia byssochlamydoides TaxID=89139 RepID=UPI0037429CF1
MDHHVSPDSTSSSFIFHHSCQPRRSPRASPSFYPHSPPSPPSLPQLRSERPFSLQTRRLQLRNAGFRGAHISSRKVSLPRNVSDQFSPWRSLSEEIEKDNQPVLSTESDDSRESGSVRRKVNVLQEIHNSSCRGRQSRRPSVTALFRNSPEETDHGRFLSGSPSPAFRSSILSSPSNTDDDSDTESVMRSQEQSRPGSSPASLHCQLGRCKRDSRTRKSSYETTRYIEHLETQLAAAQSQLSPMQSSASRPQVSKLRSLNAEIKALKEEIAEWESKFEARVREEITARTEVEAKLRARIRVLESQVELGSCRIKELEYEKEIQAQKLRDAESLKSTNRSLERRVDVLTELLAQSPARTESPRSPIHAVPLLRSPGPRLSRPRSMVPSIPSARRGSLFQPTIVTDASPLPEIAIELDSCKPGQTVSQADSIPELDFDTSTVSSSSGPKSQRSSAMSQYSSESSHWSLPLPFPPDFHGKTQGRPRSMRRFPSGTCTLKPLILPATTAQASDCPSQQSLFSDSDPSPASFDPTTAFFHNQIDEVPEEEMSDSAHSMAQQETLAALEGRSDYYKTYDEAILKHGERLSDSLAPENSCSNDGYSSLQRRTRIGDVRSSATCFSPTEGVDILPYQEAESTHGQSCPSNMESIDSQRTPMSTQRIRIRNQKPGSIKTPKACAREYKSPDVYQASTRGATVQIAEILLNFCGCFKGFKSSHFSALARRIIANVWNRSMRRIGKLSWWVLGLLVGSQTRRAWFKTTPSVLAADNYEWHRYSVGVQEGAHSGVSEGLHSVSCEDRSAPSTGLQPTSRRKQLEVHSSSSVDRHAHGNSLGHTLCLWAKFSVALVVAIGLALRHGPGSLLEGDPPLLATDGPDRACPNKEDSPPSPVGKTRLPSKADHRERGCEDDSNISCSTAVPGDPGPPKLVLTPALTMEDFLTG